MLASEIAATSGDLGMCRSSSSPASPPADGLPEEELYRTWSVATGTGCRLGTLSWPRREMQGVKGEEVDFLAKMEDRTLSVSQADRREMHLSRTNSTPARTDSTPARSDTVLGYGSSQRDLLARQANQGTRKVPIDAGQTGSVFLLEVEDRKVAVFKPEAGEGFQRQGFRPGAGAVREEAVYIVDRLCASEARVPVTTLAEVVVDGQAVRGAVQAFHGEVAGFAEDFGMPRSPADALAIVSRDCAERLALLDVRVFNTDRHGGNLLFLGHGPPYKLGPIDHGCCLPPWWALGEAGFSAWESWGQLQGNPSAAVRASARRALETLPRLCAMLRDRGLEFDAIVTLRLCTTFAAIGIGEQGLSLARAAELMTREDYSNLSWFEQKVFDCAVSVGAKLTKQLDARGDATLVLADDDARDEAWADRLVAALTGVLRAELASGACSDSDDDYTLERTFAAVPS